MPSTRRLAAILAADVAGYSRLMGADEEGTLERLKALRGELVDPKIVEHHGRMVKTTGDGLLIEFQSVIDAVRCAVEVQEGMAERNAEIPQDKRIGFRVGINLGDVIAEDDDIFGDGVNIAARLEALSEPGRICAAVSCTIRCATSSTSPLRTWVSSKSRTSPGQCISGVSGLAQRRWLPRLYHSRQAVYRGLAVSEPKRRPGAGILRRRDGRGNHHCAVSA
jgi:class 3 adenylate cyclase